jgi:hypothetical protein
MKAEFMNPMPAGNAKKPFDHDGMEAAPVKKGQSA